MLPVMALYPSPTGSFLADFLFATFILYALSLYRSYARLSHIPGPALWGWTVFPLFRDHLDGSFYHKFANLHKKYGPLVRIAPSTVLLADPDELRRMSAARSSYTRAPWYVAMRVTPGVDNVFSSRDEAYHNDRRRKMVTAYSGKESPNLESDIDNSVNDLLDLIDRKYISSPPEKCTKMDLAQKLQFFTSDVTSTIAFSDNFHDLRDDQDNYSYIKEVEKLFPQATCLMTTPSVIYFLTGVGLAKLLAPSPKDAFGLGKILFLSQTQVAKRYDASGKVKPDDKGDMLASFLRHGLTRSEAEQEGVIQLAAGSDTTATGLRTTLLNIISNSRVYAKILAEIDSVLLAGKISRTQTDVISDEQAKKLPYLQACIKEGLRMLPPAGGMLAKYSPPGGDMVCGYKIPANITMAYSVKAVHRSTALFGPDEDVYRPERWISSSQGGDEPSTEKIQMMEKNNDLIFGHGKYQCLGKTIAATEMNKVVFEVLNRFDLAVVDPFEPIKTVCFGIHLQKDFWVTVRKRVRKV